MSQTIPTQAAVLMRILLLVALFCTPPLFAAAVKLEEKGNLAILSNGIITASIHKDGASIRSLRFRGTEFIRQQRGGAYYSMDGGKNYRTPANCTFRIHHQTPELIDIAMKQMWKGHAQAVDIEIHYVIREGVSGLHTYAVVSHPAEYPATTFSEWRMVWKLPDDLLDTICVDRLRFRKMPTAADFSKAKRTEIAEIVQLTTGAWAGKFDCKYDYNADYHSTPFWGHADSRSGLGAWMVFGSHEWFNDGPTKQDLTSADRIIHVHFGMNHYHSKPTAIAGGEEWRKTYGPFMLYLNQVEGGAAAAVQDAKRQTGDETAAWPYAWMPRSADFPPAAERGNATGTFQIADPAKPALTSANAWIGLSQPDPGGNWQFESKRYQYWTRVDADGRFTIPHVRPGTYTLSAFVDGAYGEFEMTGVEIKAGRATDLGAITWNIPRDRGRLVWEIGVPNRRADEFRHGDDYFQGFLWKNFHKEFSNPLDYRIGSSVPAKDWNYAHSRYTDEAGKAVPWKWRIHFDLDQAPASDATLTIGIASADRARLSLYANEDRKPFHSFDPKINGGNALLREGIHAKYSFYRIPIPAASLRKGNNVLTLNQIRTYSPGYHVMYDALSLEVPE
jgi:rhamnogalacturonan endolyase